MFPRRADRCGRLGDLPVLTARACFAGVQAGQGVSGVCVRRAPDRHPAGEPHAVPSCWAAGHRCTAATAVEITPSLFVQLPGSSGGGSAPKVSHWVPAQEVIRCPRASFQGSPSPIFMSPSTIRLPLPLAYFSFSFVPSQLNQAEMSITAQPSYQCVNLTLWGFYWSCRQGLYFSRFYLLLIIHKQEQAWNISQLKSTLMGKMQIIIQIFFFFLYQNIC